MIKSFDELYKLNIDNFVSKKPTFKFDKVQNKFVETGVTLDYLNWADCVCLLHQNGAENVKYGNLFAQDGHSLFMNGGKVPEIHIYVDIDGDRRELAYPLIDGATDIKVEKMTQSDIHNATQRAFVKCVAINWGLGLKLWQKEEKIISEEKKPIEEDLSNHNIFAIKKRLQEEYTVLLKRHMSAEDIAKALEMSVDEVKVIFTYFDILDRFEKKLTSI